jgi:hypothetical protein
MAEAKAEAEAKKQGGLSVEELIKKAAAGGNTAVGSAGGEGAASTMTEDMDARSRAQAQAIAEAEARNQSSPEGSNFRRVLSNAVNAWEQGALDYGNAVEGARRGEPVPRSTVSRSAANINESMENVRKSGKNAFLNFFSPERELRQKIEMGTATQEEKNQYMLLLSQREKMEQQMGSPSSFRTQASSNPSTMSSNFRSQRQ